MEEGGLLSKGQLSPLTVSGWARDFTDGGRGLYAKTAQSALAVILILVMRCSD